MITFDIIILIGNLKNKKLMNLLWKTEKKVEDRKFQQNGIHHKNIFEKEKKKQIKKKNWRHTSGTEFFQNRKNYACDPLKSNGAFKYNMQK